MTRTPVAPPIPTPTLGSRASVVNVVLVRRAIAPHAGQACRAAPAKSALPSWDQPHASPPASLRVAYVALSEVARPAGAASPPSASKTQAETSCSLHARRRCRPRSPSRDLRGEDSAIEPRDYRSIGLG